MNCLSVLYSGQLNKPNCLLIEIVVHCLCEAFMLQLFHKLSSVS